MIRTLWVGIVGVAALLILGPLAALGAYLRFPRGFFDYTLGLLFGFACYLFCLLLGY